MKSKAMKRIVSLACAVCIGLSLFGVGAFASEAKQDEVYLTKTEEINDKLCELLGDEAYISLFSVPNVADLVAEWRGDWMNDEDRKQALVWSISYSDFLTVAVDTVQSYLPEELTETGKAQVRVRILAMLSSYLNREGADAATLAATVTMNVMENFHMPEQADKVTLVLEDFGEEHPMVFIRFVVDDNGNGSANATLVMHSKTTDTLLEATEGEVSETIEELVGTELPETVKELLDAMHVAVY